MKKTLIALALGATVVSGSAMAWQGGDFNGSLNIGGTLKPSQIQNPWEVEVGQAVSDINGSMIAGNKKASIDVKKAISVLGIRTVQNQPFQGAPGLSPMITYANNAVDFSNAKAGTGVLTLDVSDAGNTKIGTLTAPIYAGAGASSAKPDGTEAKKLAVYANTVGNAFLGGLPENAALADRDPWVTVAAINPDYVANFDDQKAADFDVSKTAFASRSYQYSGFYGSGIPAGSKINVMLDNPIQADTQWKASLPITVSYQ